MSVAKTEAVERIAKTLGIDTLEPQGRDQLDFHDIGVANLRTALEAAYEAGAFDAKVAACREMATASARGKAGR